MVPFTIFGFPPARSKARIAWLGLVAEVTHTFAFFEAPHRIHATLSEAGSIFGDRPITAGRELTKVHQEFIRGSALEIAKRLSEPRGEFTIVVGPDRKTSNINPIEVTDEEVAAQFWQITESGAASRREAINQVAKTSGRSPKQVYAVVERSKKLGI